MIKLRHLAAASAVVLTLAVAAPPASAQWVVYDPTNFSQNVLTAARELQQINNQITMLTNQATSLVNQARNLANLPMSTLTQLQSSIAQTQSLLSQAQNIAFNVRPGKTLSIAG
jgi:P-type conjugative transfer protein TrbJ